MLNRFSIMLAALALLLTGCSQGGTSSSSGDTSGQADDSSDTSVVDEVKQIESEYLPRVEGFNSVELNFYKKIDINDKEALSKSYNKLKLDMQIYCIYSNTEAYYTLEEAERANAIKWYHDEEDRVSFLLKEGFKFNGKFDPLNKSSISTWDDSKANYPFEITATKEGNNKLNRFNISIDYESSIVRTVYDIQTLD